MAKQSALNIDVTPGGGFTYTFPSATTTLAGLATTNTYTAANVLAAGTTTLGPLRFQSGTNLTTAIAGTIEYDGTTSYFTRASSERGVIPATQHITLTTAFTTAGGTTALQKLFNSPTNGTLTVAGSTTFYFECIFSLTAISASSGTFSFGFGGTATFTRVMYHAYANKLGSFTGQSPLFTLGTAAAATIISGTGNVNTTGWASITGKVVVGTGGTLIPSFATSVAAASIVGNDSYFKIWPAGSNTVQSVGNWS